MKVHVEGVAAGMRSVFKQRLTRHGLTGEAPMLPERQPGIDRFHAVVSAGELAIGEQHAHVGLLAKLALRADHTNGGPLSKVWIAGIEPASGGAIVDAQQA